MTVVGEAFIEISPTDKGFEQKLLRQANTAAKKAAGELADIPVTADAVKLDTSVVNAAKAAARKATKELQDIPGGVDAAEFERRVSAAATDAATKAAARLANIPAGVDVSKLEAQVANAAAKAATSASVEVPLKADGSGLVREVDQSMDQAERRVDVGARRMRDDTGSALGGLGGLVAKSFAAIGVGQLLFGSVEAVRQARSEARETEAVIRSTGGAANVTAKDIDRLTASIRAKKVVDDDEVRSGANMLLTFTNVRNEAGRSNDVFNQSVDVLVDMAAKFGNIESASIQLGKALNDPIAGVSALAEVGVSFTEQQKEQIRTLVEAGNTAAAQRIILGELRKEFGGTAAAQADDLDRLALKYDDFKERAGGAILRVVGILADLPGPIQAAGIGLAGLAVAAVAIDKVASAVSSLRERASESSLPIGGVAKGLGLVAGAAGGIFAVATAADALGLSARGLEIDVAALARTTDAELVRAFTQLQKLPGEAAKFFDALPLDQAQRLVAALRSMGIESDDLAGKVSKRAKAEADAAGSTDKARAALDGMAGASSDTAAAVDDTTDALDEAAKSLDAFRTALDKAIGLQVNSQEAAIDYIDTVQRLRDSVVEHGKTLDLNSDAGRRNREAILAVISSAREHVQAMAEEGATADQVRATFATHRTELENVLRQLGFNKSEAASYVGILDKVPATVFTNLEVKDDKARATLRTFVDVLDKTLGTERIITIKVDPVTGVVTRSTGQELREHGGPVHPGQQYLTGERRPEWFEPAGWSMPSLPPAPTRPTLPPVPRTAAALPPVRPPVPPATPAAVTWTPADPPPAWTRSRPAVPPPEWDPRRTPEAGLPSAAMPYPLPSWVRPTSPSSSHASPPPWTRSYPPVARPAPGASLPEWTRAYHAQQMTEWLPRTPAQPATAAVGPLPHVVGRRGPELFTPATPGRIVPTVPTWARGLSDEELRRRLIELQRSASVWRQVPRAASGAIVQPSPGGTLVQVAEAGQAEAIIPLPPGLVPALERLASSTTASPGNGGLFRDLVVQGATVDGAWATGLEVLRQMRAEANRATGGKLFQ